MLYLCFIYQKYINITQCCLISNIFLVAKYHTFLNDLPYTFKIYILMNIAHKVINSSQIIELMLTLWPWKEGKKSTPETKPYNCINWRL